MARTAVTSPTRPKNGQITPDLLSGLVLWLKADAITGVANGATVATWSDSSGSSNDATQGTAAAQPTYVTNSQNGLPTLSFDGGDFLRVANEPTFDIANPSMFVVVKRTAGGSILSKNTLVANTSRRHLQIATTSSLMTLSAGNDANSISETAAPNNWSVLGGVTRSDSDHDLYDGLTVTTSGATLFDSVMNNAPLDIGQAFGNGTEAFTGNIAEIVIFNRALTTTEAQMLVRYLAEKWGITVTQLSLSAAGARPFLSNYTGAVDLTAANAQVSWGNIQGNTNTVVTAAFLWKPTVNSTVNQETIWGYGNQRWFFIYGNTTTALRFAVTAGSEQATANIGPLTIGQWYRIIGTYDPAGGANNLTIRIYDSTGTLAFSTTNTAVNAMNTSGSALQLGHDPNRSFYQKGKASDCRVYGRVLTVTEQDNLAKNIDPSTSNLLLQTKFNEGSGTTAADSSGNAQTATLTNATFTTSDVPFLTRTAA